MTEPSNPRRRWFRFSILGLLIAMAIASVLLAWRVKAVRDVDNALATLDRAGFALWRYPYAAEGVSLPSGWHLPRPYWQRIFIGEGKHYSQIHQNGEQPISDAAIRDLLPSFQATGRELELLLYGPSITDAALRDLESLRTLKRLYLNQTSATEGGIARLQKALPDCHIDSFSEDTVGRPPLY